MRSRNFVAALLFLLGSAGIASAQALSLEFHDGRVKLTAENVPVARILAEWARLGGTQIVNGERIPGAPVTLQLDAPERQALEIVLRSAAGYMVLGRDANSTGASSFAKIMVLPTTSRDPAAAALPQPPSPPPQFREPEPEVEEEEPQPPGPGPGNFRRGRFPNVNAPQGGAPIPPDDNEEIEPEEEEPEPPAPGNPFGVVPGGARPGTINTPPRSPGEAEQTPR